MRAAKNLLFVFFLLETLCVTYVLKFPALISSATILYTISGVAIAVLFLYVPERKINLKYIPDAKTPVWMYQWFLLSFLGIFIISCTQQWIQQSPLTYRDADMIPIMQVMAERFLAGNWSGVYDPVQEIWNGIQPIYLPAMWMPFLVTIKSELDPRWVTSFAVFLSFTMFIALWRIHWQKLSALLLLGTAAMLCYWLYTDNTHNFIRLSEEGIVVFYYSLLVLAIFSENFLLIGIVAALCALSRYTIAGWLPAMILYLLLIRKQKRDTVRFVCSFASVVVLLVLLPFGTKPLQIAFQQPSQYIQHAARIWNESPAYFTQSMGLAKFFGPDHIVLQHTILLYASFLLPLLCVLGIRYLPKQYAYNNIPLALLKLTLVIVYNLIDVPYQYLFYTSSFVSLLAVVWVTGNRKMANKN